MAECNQLTPLPFEGLNNTRNDLAVTISFTFNVSTAKITQKYEIN